VTADQDGSLDDPTYIAGHRGRAVSEGGQNVAALSISAAASLLAQYVSLNIAPGGLGEPGPLQYLLATHTLDHLTLTTRPTCPVETLTGDGDSGPRLTGHHPAADDHRHHRARTQLPLSIRTGRVLDNLASLLRSRLVAHGRQILPH
jgi:hypothetical protein